MSQEEPKNRRVPPEKLLRSIDLPKVQERQVAERKAQSQPSTREIPAPDAVPRQGALPAVPQRSSEPSLRKGALPSVPSSSPRKAAAPARKPSARTPEPPTYPTPRQRATPEPVVREQTKPAVAPAKRTFRSTPARPQRAAEPTTQPIRRTDSSPKTNELPKAKPATPETGRTRGRHSGHEGLA